MPRAVGLLVDQMCPRLRRAGPGSLCCGLNAPLSHAWRPCTWPKLQPPTKPRAAQAAANNRFDWLLCCRVARAMWLRFPAWCCWVDGGCSKQGLGRSACEIAAAASAQQCDSVQDVERQQQCSVAASRSLVKTLGPGWSAARIFRSTSSSPGQMSRRVEKPPACGRFGFGASVLQAASPPARACSTGASEA